MKLTLELDGTLLDRRQAEWAQHLAHPAENPLSTRASFTDGELLLENALCVYSQDSRFSDGLPYSGFIVTKRPCETVFDLTPEELVATHALLSEVRAQLESTVQPDGYTVGWNVFPAGGAHIPHVHLHVIPRWKTDAAAGVGLRWFLRQVAEALHLRSALPADLPAIHDLILQTGLSDDRAKITATLEGCSYWVAVQQGRVVGCIGLEHGEGASLLRSASVAPTWQGRGIGARLAETALSVARGRGERAVYLFSSHAGAYWQRHGFVQVPVTELSAALPGTPQVQSGECRGWIHSETAWKLDLSG
ncbi:GNAT family N-acetyltransferase [Deinococcus sp. KNUC1210]|uniref:GNAT family N-acetyltransferase n=1 Tax=Deinococcus sp. KNUC1210 TaxID=2917691 RepID=UPI001EF066F7|nr:GNAT family N-acetyltransferase [Deinococcus sp. KNUC1210]ULH14569.1 GNAT family N-acetyltransferase [Deinococcus sp. KNUC1210]